MDCDKNSMSLLAICQPICKTVANLTANDNLLQENVK